MKSMIQFGTGLSASLVVMACAAAPIEKAVAQNATVEAAVQAAKQRVIVRGKLVQGGLVFGEVLEQGTTILIDGKEVAVDTDGNFVIGFGRDHGPTALLTATYPDGTSEPLHLNIEDREFKEQSITGLDSSKVNKFTENQLKHIRESTAKKKAARKNVIPEAAWISGFEWPSVGRISGVFGSRRILNGVPKRPHSGLDIAAKTGTPVRAPASGTVTLADADMYFEGQMVFINHGQGLESALMHLSRIDVQAGQPVEKGEIIGAVGATGRATGPHVHWSLKWQDTLVDPQLLVQDLEMEKAE